MTVWAEAAGSWVPVVVFWPLAAAFLAAGLARFSDRAANSVIVVSAGLTLVAVMALGPAVLAAGKLEASVPALTGQLSFMADAFGILFALLGAFVWFAATLYAAAFLARDPARLRFQLTSLVLLSANLGVVLAGDLLGLFVFFELLGLVALVLVVHDGTATARRAAVKYFWMTLVGGVALLAGIFLVSMIAGGTALEPTPLAGADPKLVWTAFGLLLVGFGVKAGMVPLHVWLPDAHPVAPAPASALLSGVMIKAGAYGIFRTLSLLFGPGADPDPARVAWDPGASMGLTVLWFGIATGLIGVTLALGQHQAKRMLAWHSVSQMGFVLTGLGVGAYLAAEGAMGTAGGLMHALNHALFKACLFLGIGAVALKAGTADMDQLGGLWRRMPVTFALMLIATAGIAGFPLFNGFVSKSMIHHALVDAAAHGGGAPLVMAEWLYMLTAAGTMASFIKLIWLVFLRPPTRLWSQSVRDPAPAMLVAMAVLAVPILLFGMKPDWLLEGLLKPGVATGPAAVEPVSRYLEEYFLGRGDLLAFAGTMVAGLGICTVGLRFGLFQLAAPGWVGVDYWYRLAGNGLVSLARGWGHGMARIRNEATRRWGSFTEQALGAWDVANVRMTETATMLLPGRQGREGTSELYRRLDALRDLIVELAAREVLERSEEPPNQYSPATDRLLNAARLVAGLLGTRLVDATMAAASSRGDRQWEGPVIQVQNRARALACSAVDLAESWVQEGDSTVVEQAAADMMTGLPSRRSVPAGRWWPELAELVVRPGERHWPVTESLDRSAVLSALRNRIQKIARNLGLAIGLVFGLLLALLLLLMV